MMCFALGCSSRASSCRAVANCSSRLCPSVLEQDAESLPAPIVLPSPSACGCVHVHVCVYMAVEVLRVGDTPDNLYINGEHLVSEGWSDIVGGKDENNVQNSFCYKIRGVHGQHSRLCAFVADWRFECDLIDQTLVDIDVTELLTSSPSDHCLSKGLCVVFMLVRLTQSYRKANHETLMNQERTRYI